MNQSKEKQLRDFIRSHEMRYFVEYSDYRGQTKIKKAFKVEIGGEEYWVYFSYGSHPELKDKRTLLKTMDEAKAKAQKLRDEHQKKKKADADMKQAKLEEVTKFLEDFRWYDYKDWKNDEIKPNGKPFAKAVKGVYDCMPRREKDDEQTYIRLLENYVKHGTIYTQAITFSKEHVVSVKYGESDAVQVELINGKTIIPKGEGVTRLIKTIFGDRLDGWSYDYVKEPADELDVLKSV